MSDADVLEPTLTKFDRRVLAALESYPDDWLKPARDRIPLPRLNAWRVAEILRHDDVAEVRGVLDGLYHFGYADVRDFGHRRRWIRSKRGDELLSGVVA